MRHFLADDVLKERTVYAVFKNGIIEIKPGSNFTSSTLTGNNKVKLNKLLRVKNNKG